MSGIHSNRLTKKSSVQSESRRGSFNKSTLRPGQTGNTREREKTWSTSSPPTGEHLSTLVPPQTGNLWQGSMPTATRSYTTPTPVEDAQTYGHEQQRNTGSLSADSPPSQGGWTNDSIGVTIPEEFDYDWDSVFPGYRPEDTGWEDPQPLADSPPNP